MDVPRGVGVDRVSAPVMCGLLGVVAILLEDAANDISPVGGCWPSTTEVIVSLGSAEEEDGGVSVT